MFEAIVTLVYPERKDEDDGSIVPAFTAVRRYEFNNEADLSDWLTNGGEYAAASEFLEAK